MPKPPDGATQAALESLNSVRGESLSSESLRDEALVYPHRGYVMDVLDVAAGRLLETAIAGPWRHMIARGQLIEESVDVVEADSNGRHRLTNRSRGTRNGAMARAIARALVAPRFRNESFEARVLAIPALSVMALWLVGNDKSLLIPVGTVPGVLKSGKQYSSDAFLAALRSSAQARLEFDNSPKSM
ncbi:MAG TPA: hypothetical protein VNU44_17940 [Bryobacteraceae bacterium]|nr:hypothetical protein [Bryobacteraceae bacterium]